MFQYAFGIVLMSRGHHVLYDTSPYSMRHRCTIRALELPHFNVRLPLATRRQARAMSNEYVCGIRLPKMIRRCFSRSINENSFPDGMWPRLAPDVPGDTYYTGVFANFDYLSPYRTDIEKAFTLQTPLTPANAAMLRNIRSTESVSLHVRRGDYVRLGLACDVSCYQQPIAEMMRALAHPHFFVFSDDIAWARQNVPVPAPHTFVDMNDGATGYFDMELMRNCQHNICAASTFSAWAAYLNPNPHKTARVVGVMKN